MYPTFAPKVPRRPAGLTVIELLLVVAMIGVLVALALPKYQSYQERIKQTHAIQDITVLQTLIRDYQLNNGNYPASLAEVGGRLVRRRGAITKIIVFGPSAPIPWNVVGRQPAMLSADAIAPPACDENIRMTTMPIAILRSI